MKVSNVFQSWGKVLTGKIPMLSVEITRECPLRCPGCYAYGDAHLGEGGPNLRSVSDYRGDDLVNRVLALVDQHQPLQLSLVGGEPMMRPRELTKLLPILSSRGIFTMVVTSGVIPIPKKWTSLPRVTIAVSVDGNPEDHDVRRKPATYERILRNIRDCQINVHWTVVRQNLHTPGYLDRYLEFWNDRPEVHRIWVSVYTPQANEASPERLLPADRIALADYFASLNGRYPKLLMHQGLLDAFLKPPAEPAACLFSTLSVNYTADLRTRVEPCVFGGTPSCSDCGCSMSMGMHWLGEYKVAGLLPAKHLITGSLSVGKAVNRLRRQDPLLRWSNTTTQPASEDLVQIR